MARIRRVPDGFTAELRARTRLGRAPGNDVLTPADDERISRDHAVISFGLGGWTVRDLGSRNGTRVDDAPLAPGAEHPLRIGSMLTLGGAQSWRLDDDAPPPASATGRGGAVVVALGDILILPGRPSLVVRRGRDGDWIVEGGRPVTDGQALGGWTLSLPVGPAATAASDDAPRGSLLLEHDEGGARVRATITLAGRVVALSVRAHHRLLLALARERARAERRGAAPGEAGWVYPEDLAQHLGIAEKTLFVHIFRLRTQLRDAGLADGRPVRAPRYTGELRTGVPAIIQG